MKVAIVGGGISGLAAAFRLRAAGCEVTVLEAEARAGGKIRTERADGWTFEHGPNGFLDSRAGIVRLAGDLGLGDRLVRAAPEAKRRYLLLDGRLVPLPGGPGALLKSDLLSLRGRLRLFAEPLVGRAEIEGDESVYDFAARRLGAEVAEKLVDAMVTGVYAGDSRLLSVNAAFPTLARLEAQYGSLLRGVIASVRTARTQPGERGGFLGKLTTFPGGMGDLVDALRAQLGDAVHTGRHVIGLRRLAKGWAVDATGGLPVEADAVVLATPAAVTAQLVGPLAPAAVTSLESIPYAPAAVVVLGFPKAAMPRDLDGFGFLVPSRERRDVLGVVWCSMLFPGRAPDGHVLMRCIVGGARRPELVALPDGELLRRVRADLDAAMGRLPEPAFTRVVRWPLAIPQYTLGHTRRVQAAREALLPLPGLHLAGAGFYGVSVPECVDRADALPTEVLAR
jgi:oxygen-dependent protoporphyrinogen oxidase